jgi:hypothetical protein
MNISGWIRHQFYGRGVGRHSAVCRFGAGTVAMTAVATMDLILSILFVAYLVA